ncbi:uncharacterized protein K460DRAFT_410809 [Cucurbitaria berberidis CBS 394.84]|uniref:F-box domain-containing protein n=1 Tax=Cucurbitaria berberidis CBS 394.84 TaxID=1168544 RepID=A0A9P4G707_9PLEO|nr:uncharacterized protein K460DRAFT_410809 [Cucurbitaria berberidis CBS 394.84]KAF1840208.1 hypothetical protein K460DRAFT_410809 [Cucurbitaria berberidis CBS 394.84]
MSNSNYHYKHQKVDSGVAGSFAKLTLSGDLGEIARYQPTLGKDSRLTALPNELLLKIAGYLRVDFPWMEKEERFDGRERTIFVTDAADLVTLSRTCKKLRPVAQEALLHTIVLGGFDSAGSIESLVRLLLRRPELGKAIRRLRMGLPPHEKLYFKSEKAAEDQIWSSKPLGPPPPHLLAKAKHVIDETPFTIAVKNHWRVELKVSFARPLCGVLLAMAPNLEHLSVSHSLGGESPDRALRQMFGIREDEVEADFSALPALTGLRYVNDATPANRRPLSSLIMEPHV